MINDMNEMMRIADDYRDFLDQGKTERECCAQIIKRAESLGFRNIDQVCELKPHDRVYAVNMKKELILFEIGAEPITQGMRILGAHMDSPRLDIKQNPLYEDKGMAYLDTHYYGGVKKYQWVTLPLAIHGVIAKKDGSVVSVSLGEDDNDPAFCVTDLLIHLSAEQLEKKANRVIEGEKLDLLIGTDIFAADETIKKHQDNKIEDTNKGEESSKEEKKDSVKKQILKILSDKYGICEDDFLSAELEVVPAGKARNMGLDSSMVLAYGHDDRVCTYGELVALERSLGQGSVTKCAIFVDKEEIGSVGATGMQSRFFENTVAHLIELLCGNYNDLMLRRCLSASMMLSADVSAGYDPLYAAVYDFKNAAKMGAGLVFNKYTGARGKSGSNDANAEYMAYLRHILDEAGVAYQTAELGKVDAGGGGTIAYIMALYGMQVIDCGVAVLNMHAPWEVICKRDLYESIKGYEAFLNAPAISLYD